MLKNIVLALSLLLNTGVAYVLLFPPRSSGPKMTCEQARSDHDNKSATETFAGNNARSFFKTHDYLRNSDYTLRNIAISDGTATFVYIATAYPSTCGTYLPGLDGGIVRVRTNLRAEPLVTAVN